jgi:hypothetical protein
MKNQLSAFPFGVALILAWSDVSRAQAPATLSGKTFGQSITDGTGPFASEGYFLFLPSTSGNAYQVVGIANVVDSSGTYSYVGAGSAGSLILTDSVVGAIEGSLTFSSASSGLFSLSKASYYQNGQFEVLSGQVPTSISGQSFYVEVLDGLPPFASVGSFILETSTNGNNYTINPLSDQVVSSAGTCSYSQVNATTGKIQLSDNVVGSFTSYVGFSNSFAGLYASTQPATGGFQIGSFTRLDLSVAITAPANNVIFTSYANSITVSGTATDHLGISSLSWQNNRGGSGQLAGANAWSISGIPLQPGTNLIIVKATDTIGHASQAALSVTYIVPLLAISLASSRVVVSWDTNLAGFALSYSTSVPNRNWFKASPIPAIVGTRYAVTNSIMGGSAFYRLQK